MKEKECFSCQKGAPLTVKERLILHKRLYEQTGKGFWFFREGLTGQTKIANDKSFETILPSLKEIEGSEWCHIAEFGHVVNDNVSKDNTRQKPKAIKSESKPKRTRGALD